MTSTPSVQGINADEQVSLLDRSVYDLKFHFDYPGGASPSAFLAFIVDIERATEKLRAFFEAGGLPR